MEAYATMMRRIDAIIERRDNDEPDIIKDYAWHLTTILNTFNAYHCYEVSLDRQREIEPVWLRMKPMNGESTISRLLLIMIDSKYKFNFLLERKTDATRLYYSYDTFMRCNPVFVQNEAVYDTRIEEQGKLDIISVATSDQSNLRMPPLYADLVYDSNGFMVYEGDNSYSPSDIYVNLKYLHPSRVLHGNDTDKLFTNSAYGDRLTNKSAHLNDYIFGVDWSYVENNFNGDVYEPRTRIRIDTKEPISKDVCFRPNGVEILLALHEGKPYIDRRNTEVTRMTMQQYACESIIIDTTNRLRRASDQGMIPDILSTPSIDPSYRTDDVTVLENRHYNLRHSIEDMTFIIDDTTNRIKNLLKTYNAS